MCIHILFMYVLNTLCIYIYFVWLCKITVILVLNFVIHIWQLEVPPSTYLLTYIPSTPPYISYQ